MRTLKLKWSWYLPFLAVYHIVLPYKYFWPQGWLVAWGIGGAYETFRNYPFTFFIGPLVLFILAKVFVFAWNAIAEGINGTEEIKDEIPA